jgi:hypothetical protein
MRRVAFHEDFSREEAIDGSSDRGFGLVFAAVLGLIGGLKLWSGKPRAGWWLVGGALFLILALLRPGALAPLNRVWLRLGLLLYKIVNPLVMGMLFYLCVTPTGLLMRLVGKDPLRLKYDPDAPTYWIERRPPGPAPDSMRNQF